MDQLEIFISVQSQKTKKNFTNGHQKYPLVQFERVKLVLFCVKPSLTNMRTRKKPQGQKN